MTEHSDMYYESIEPPGNGGIFNAELRINELEQECAARDKRLEEMRQKLLCTEIGRRTALMGIPPERAGHITRLAKLDSVWSETGDLNDDALGNAIDDVLSEIPELRGVRAYNGAFNPKGAAATKSDAYRQQISAAHSKGDLLTVVSLKRKAKIQGISV